MAERYIPLARRLPTLGAVMRRLREESPWLTMKDLSVLAQNNDPLRLNTPAGHRDGQWLAKQIQACGLLGRIIHLRGLHYAIFTYGAVLPDGVRYTNTDEHWLKLQDIAKAARWLGYVPFGAIRDARNEEPIIRLHDSRTAFTPNVEPVDTDCSLLRLNSRRPIIEVSGAQMQRYRQVFFGEKTSLSPVLDPLALELGADLYLPAGEISDTLLWQMAKTGSDDGREMVVFVFADCDPAGYQMAVSIAHKLRLMRETLFPNLRFQLHASALTVEQVKIHGLPSTPLKEGEKRAGGWRERYGVEQTEIDALATLQPETLEQIVRDAVAPFFDATLQSRVEAAAEEWRSEVQSYLDDEFATAIDDPELRRLDAEAREALEAFEDRLIELTDGLDYDAGMPPDLPEVELPEESPRPLVSTDMELIDAIGVLRQRKDYSNGQEDE